MRSRLFLLTAGMVVASAACAQGTSFTGGAGAAGGGTAASSSATSTFLAAHAASTTGSSLSTSSGTCADSPCKLTSPQCGCGAGQECSIVSYMPACQPAGTGTEGQACAAAGDCAPGLLCLGGGTTGICDQFCTADADCASLGGICALTLSDGTATGTIPNATLCSNTCNPATGTGCSVPGTGCQVGQESTGQMRWLTFCSGAGTKGSGQTCTSSSDCKPQYGCLNTGNADECVQYCDVNNPSCSGATTCGALMDSATSATIVVDGITLGACQ